MDANLKELQKKVEEEAMPVKMLLGEVQKVIAGQRNLVERLLVALLSGDISLSKEFRGLQKRLR
mgnify:CR=1 FL=1